jgi:short-subunit dehydrogenase
MSLRLKPVDEQVVVLTGASSGIGLATARAAAARGAKLVLVARNETALQDLAREIRNHGGRAVAVVADVSKHEDLERVAKVATDTFGGFDTWINDAAVAIYGSFEQTPIEDQRRLFEVNYWGVVNGSLIAARHLKERGGAIINLGSILSHRSLMLQGAYSASKHAVKAFTDALRMELEHEGAPISVTLIKPSAIDTPYMEHARSYLDAPGTRNPPPSYDPHLVAKAILHACEYPKRDLVVGFGGWALATLGRLFPRATDLVMEATMERAQKSDLPGRQERRDNLYAPREDGAEHSSLPGTSRKTSLFLEAQMHPLITFAVLAGVGVLLGRSMGSRPGRRAAIEERQDRTAHRRGNGQDHAGMPVRSSAPEERGSTASRM